MPSLLSRAVSSFFVFFFFFPFGRISAAEIATRRYRTVLSNDGRREKLAGSHVPVPSREARFARSRGRDTAVVDTRSREMRFQGLRKETGARFGDVVVSDAFPSPGRTGPVREEELRNEPRAYKCTARHAANNYSSLRSFAEEGGRRTSLCLLNAGISIRRRLIGRFRGRSINNSSTKIYRD